MKPYLINEADCPNERWDDPVRGRVDWRTLLSGDRTPTSGLTMGVAEAGPVGAEGPRLHRHAQAEAYYILSGRGVLRIDGEDHPLSAGTTVFIPGGAWHGAAAVGGEPLKILYVFAADSFEDIVYEFQAP